MTDLAVATAGDSGEFADAYGASVACAFHELDQEVRAHEHVVVLLGSHLFTSVDGVCVCVNKDDSTRA
jgi:hypothetical protein